LVFTTIQLIDYNITFQLRESSSLLWNLVSLESKDTRRPNEELNYRATFEMAQHLLETLPKLCETDNTQNNLNCNPSLLAHDPLKSFIRDEMSKFDTLLKVIRDTLNQLIGAIQGSHMMSMEIDRIHQSITTNKVEDFLKN